MSGLLIKDIYLLKKSFSWSYLFPIVVFIVSCSQNSVLLAMLLSVGVFFVATSLAITTIMIDHQYGWDETLRSLPVSMKQAVVSKYLFFLIINITAFLLVAVIEYSIAAVFSVHYSQILIAIAVGISSTLLFSAVLLPVVYRFGTIKMPIAVISYTAVMFLMFSLGNTFDLLDIIVSLSMNAWVLSSVIVLVSFAVFIASIPLSVLFSSKSYALL